MFYAHAQKQTNKQTQLSLSLSLWTLSFSSFYPERNNCCYFSVSFFPLLSSHLRQHNSAQYCISFLLHITTLPPPSACLSWDAQTLWPPRRGSFERVSSWWWGQFRPWRRSSSGGSRRSSCPCPPALGAGWPSCRWCGPRGQSSSPLLRRAARRPPDHVHYLERWEGKMTRRDQTGQAQEFKYVYAMQSLSNAVLQYSKRELFNLHGQYKYRFYHIVTVQFKL